MKDIDREIDQLLTRDAVEWNLTEPSAPDFDEALRAVTAPRRLFTSSARRFTGAISAVVVVAATVLVAVVVGAHRHAGSAGHPGAGHPPKAARSIVVHGKTIPYAGGVPWAGAVVADARSSSLTIFADGDSIVSKRGVCGLPDERVYASETSTSVTILVAGYETPTRSNVCAGVGHGPQIQRLTLAAPLGRRTLIDATGQKVHHVLDATSVPAPPVPARFSSDPVQWDEKTGIVSRVYRVRMTELIELQYGSTSAMDPNGGAVGSVVETVQVGRTSAEVFRYTDSLNDETTVVWSVGNHRLALSVLGYPKQHFSIAAVIEMARSVH